MRTTQIDHDATTILRVLAEMPRDEYITGPDLATRSGLSSGRINDAVTLLVDAGYVEWVQVMGTAPYDFGEAAITPRGRYECQRLALPPSGETAPNAESELLGSDVSADGSLSTPGILPPVPIGSPYGFTDEDWEIVSERKGRQDRVYTVLGHQFESDCFDTDALRRNVESMMRRATVDYNARAGREHLSLEHRNLSAGYGEHLFNEIARNIIGADIAVFEVSDLNPNVMLEMGVALTWGVRVLPIKVAGKPKPPTDVSGQTWADYAEDALEFTDRTTRGSWFA